MISPNFPKHGCISDDHIFGQICIVFIINSSTEAFRHISSETWPKKSCRRDRYCSIIWQLMAEIVGVTIGIVVVNSSCRHSCSSNDRESICIELDTRYCSPAVLFDYSTIESAESGQIQNLSIATPVLVIYSEWHICAVSPLPRARYDINCIHYFAYSDTASKLRNSTQIQSISVATKER